MFQIQQPQGNLFIIIEWRNEWLRHEWLHDLILNSASAAAPAGANAAAQMMDPSSGYAFIDPTYAALALQVSHHLWVMDSSNTHVLRCNNTRKQLHKLNNLHPKPILLNNKDIDDPKKEGIRAAYNLYNIV